MKTTKDKPLRAIVGGLLILYSLPSLYISSFMGGMMTMMGRGMGLGTSILFSLGLLALGAWLVYDGLREER